MIKGVTRQVILVDSPDRQCFEKAIFILSDDSASLSEQELLEEARALAAAATRAEKGRRERLRGILWALAGAGSVGAAWLIAALLA